MVLHLPLLLIPWYSYPQSSAITILPELAPRRISPHSLLYWEDQGHLKWAQIYLKRIFLSPSMFCKTFLPVLKKINFLSTSFCVWGFLLFVSLWGKKKKKKVLLCDLVGPQLIILLLQPAKWDYRYVLLHLALHLHPKTWLPVILLTLFSPGNLWSS